MRTFLEFVDKRERDTRHHLKTVKKLLEKHGFTVDSYLNNDDDPYIFLHANDEQLSFEGVRIYQLGDVMAFRVQKEKDTHPYGKAYALDIESMFDDLISDNGNEKKSGEKVIEAVVHEFKKFFKNSRQAENELKTAELDDSERDGAGKVLIKNNLLDYGSMIGNKVS